MISVPIQGKPFSIIAIQVYTPTTNAKEAEVKRFYDDLKDLTEHLFIIGDWNAKIGSQEIPGVNRQA